MRRFEISNSEWDKLKDLLPGETSDRGQSAKDNRLFINAVMYVAKTGDSFLRIALLHGRNPPKLKCQHNLQGLTLQFQFLLVQLRQGPERSRRSGNFVSIPLDAIKTLLTKQFNSFKNQFQFLLVQLRLVKTAQKKVPLLVSIPLGAIKTSRRGGGCIHPCRVSIPLGAIKTASVMRVMLRVDVFQFLLVQLRRLSNSLHLPFKLRFNSSWCN